MSLIVVMTALPARLLAVPFDTVNGYWFVVVNLLAGSLVGAWTGATWATRMRSATLYRVLAVLLVLIAVALAWNHFGDLNPVFLDPVARTLLALAAGVGVGIVAALMGVAGGELLIPTIVLLFAVDIKIAGSLPRHFLAHHARSVRPLQPRQQLRNPSRQQRLRTRHGDWIDHRYHPRRSPPRCRPRSRADPPAGRASPRVCDQGLASQLTRHGRDDNDRKGPASQAVQRRTAAQLWFDEGWIFSDEIGRALNPRTDWDNGKKLLKAARVRDGRLHDARHTAATVLLLLGVHERTIMSVLGWSTTAMVSRYAHVIAPIHSHVASRLDVLLWSSPNSEKDDRNVAR
jgi:hypothetical protein